MRSRGTSTLKAKLERNLLAYTTAASAAGLGITAIAQPAVAEVVYTPAHVRIGTDALRSYTFDINHDGIGDVKLATGSYCHFGCSIPLYGLSAQAPPVGRVSFQVARIGSRVFENARKRGGQVGPQKTFRNGGTMALGHTNFDSSLREYGPWADVKGRYLGIKFKLSEETHYGWARLNVHYSIMNHQVALNATLTGYAYETIPDKPIVAGDEGAGASLGHLALGAAGKKR